jgi:restriction system protein
MSQTSEFQNLPEVVGYIPRVIVALRALDGVAKAAAVRNAIVEAMNASGEPINETQHSSGVLKYANDIAWARMYLVNAGLIEPPTVSGRGVWKLTEAGWTSPLDTNAILAIYGKKPAQNVEGLAELESSQQELPGLDTWELQVKKILTTMPDQGFERFCAYLMTRNGLQATKVTGKTGDGGVDGEGLLALDQLSLIRTPVAWQCKRYAEKPVMPDAVRDFRGAIEGRAKYGLIFTTSAFTSGAEQEARRQGATTIELVGVERLVELIGSLEIGICKAADGTPEADSAFFAEYLNPAGGH